MTSTTSETTSDNAPPEHTDHQSAYIVGPLYDWLLFLGTPIAALVIGFLISGTNFADNLFEFHGWDVTGSTLVLGIIVHAHLVAVFFRSHGNPKFFEAHPARFILVPIILYAGMLFSPWIFVIVSVTATFWDVYHSGMQTFGFGRIYDRKRGNDPMLGRKLDWALNVLLYAGPIIGGATMIDHFEDFGEFAEVGDLFFTQIPAYMEGIHGTLFWVALTAGSSFIAFYLAAY